MMTIDFLLNRASATLVIFLVSAAIAGLFTRSPVWRAVFGLAGILIALVIGISTRSLLEWTTSAIERPSLPGLVVLIVLAIATIGDWKPGASAEFRFATLMLAIAGTILYPAAVGFLDYDTYVLGYSGYVLPLALATILAYAIFRRYLITALVLNVAIAAFLLGAGHSVNLWDYVVDPVAWLIGMGTWIALGVKRVMARFTPAKTLAAA
ncbi:hypothetical protein [Hyphomicrobium sp.]|uniref:hypothetical protein n=1 Tax=Hyphomicrobium sp. TaxID=82 RepID=UPI002D7A2F15|nr:hypothetical protein [Hyphomicrobium sp.]HET6389319.1 hypothetical protein [Hyphomicrobium sp.]